MRRGACILLLFAALSVSAQERPGGKVQWRCDLDFHYYFDNREFDASGSRVLRSGTTHAAVLVPTLSAKVQGRRTVHGLTMGADLQHDMGSQTCRDLPREGILYYSGTTRTRTGVFQGVAGIYPRTLMRGWYSEAFFSDLNRFTDRNFEGVLLKWRAPRFYTEAALDWMGQRGYDRKERFQIISAGAWQAGTILNLGWTADYYHYAGSELAPGVVDHGLLQPWAKVDFAAGTPWQELSLRAGALLSYQWDRNRADRASAPCGGEVTLTFRRWGAALENNCYFGADLLPLYDGVDLAGRPYGDNLYFGHRLYSGFYDRIGLRWERRLGRAFRLRIGARAHFTAEGFMGWQQTASLRFDLGERLGRR